MQQNKRVFFLVSAPPDVGIVGLADVRVLLFSGLFQCTASALRRRAGVLCGREDLRVPSGDRGLDGAARRAVRLHLRLELGHLLRAGQVLQEVVLLLQLSVALDQLLDLLLQDLHLLSHGIHQVALHQILQDERDEQGVTTSIAL